MFACVRTCVHEKHRHSDARSKAAGGPGVWREGDGQEMLRGRRAYADYGKRVVVFGRID